MHALEKIKTLLVLSALIAVAAVAAPVKKPVPPVVWCGVDYSLALFAGGEGFKYGFNVAETLPAMFDKWNQLYVDERLPGVGAALRRRVVLDMAGVSFRNVGTSVSVVAEPSYEHARSKPELTDAAISNAVQTLQLDNAQGVGLVYVVDKLVCRLLPPDRNNAPPQNFCIGVVHVVFFDLATREILVHKKPSNLVRGGGNFRNFWFSPIKDADEVLAGCRYKIAKHP